MRGRRGSSAKAARAVRAGEDGDGDGEAGEALDQADAEALVEGDDDCVRAQRIALDEELGRVAFGEAVGGQQVLGHVGVEAGAEDAEVALRRGTAAAVARSAPSATGQPARETPRPVPSTLPRR